jgi:16S rRNA (guanine527-N7)-methyltransferase
MGDLSSRLEQLADRWELPERAPKLFDLLLGVLARDAAAPTAVAAPPAAVDVHLADSLSVLDIQGFRSLSNVVDIGSGAGFPGIVLAIAMPETRIDLLESTRRKCEFLERLIEKLGLENAGVVCSRAEQWAESDGRERYAGAVVRAVGPLATLIEYAAPLLRVDGLLVAWKGRRDSDEERRAAEAAEMLGMRPSAVVRVKPFAGSESRHLHSFEKLAPTPAGYPRRPGMAKKRPLGSGPSRPGRQG